MLVKQGNQKPRRNNCGYKKMKVMRVTISLVLTLTLVLGVVPVLNTAISGSADYIAQAKSKKLEMFTYKTNIGLYGKDQLKAYMFEEERKNGKFTFKSNKPKVVGVSKKGIVTGKKYGKAKITIVKKYKKKTKRATFTVTVKKAYLFKKNGNIGTIGKSAFATYYNLNYRRGLSGEYENIFCKNKKAKYIFKSLDKSKLTIKDNGKVVAVKKIGKVKINIKEKYKKKTRNLGNLVVNIAEPRFTEAGKTLHLHYGDEDDSDAGTYWFEDENCFPLSPSFVLFLTDSLEEIEEIKKDPVKAAAEQEKILSQTGVLQGLYRAPGADEDDINTTGKGGICGLRPIGPGTVYLMAYDATKKWIPKKFLGYCTIKVTKAEE